MVVLLKAVTHCVLSQSKYTSFVVVNGSKVYYEFSLGM